MAVGRAQHGKQIIETNADQAGPCDNGSHAADALRDEAVGGFEGILHAIGGQGYFAHAVVLKDDDGVAELPQIFQRFLGLHHAAVALEGKWQGGEGDDHGPGGAGDTCDFRCCAGAGAAAQAGAEEDQFPVCHGGVDIGGAFRGSFLADFRVAAGAEAARQPGPELDAVRLTPFISARESVFSDRTSAPPAPSMAMRSTTLHPAPPTPRTLMVVPWHRVGLLGGKGKVNHGGKGENSESES